MTIDRNTTHELIQHYYDAFNAQDHGTMLDLVADDLRHDINQGEREQGKDLFAAFLQRMDSAYSEQLRDIAIMTSPDGARAAAEFVVHGTYKVGDEGLPPAHGQSYILPAGAFFEVERGRISRISVYYNLADWIAQVS